MPFIGLSRGDETAKGDSGKCQRWDKSCFAYDPLHEYISCIVG